MPHGTTPVERRAGTICYNTKCTEQESATNLCLCGISACRDRKEKAEDMAK